MNGELTALKRILLNTSDSNFHFCVEYYLNGTKKSDFQVKLFLDEFSDTPEIANLLEDFYKDNNYSIFKRELLKLSNDVVQAKLVNPRTSYKELANLSEFVSLGCLKGLLCFFDADDLKGSRKIRFTYLFKLLEPVFLFPPSTAQKLSENKLRQIKKSFTEYSCTPSEDILDCLKGNASMKSYDLDDVWLIHEIRKSL